MSSRRVPALMGPCAGNWYDFPADRPVPHVVRLVGGTPDDLEAPLHILRKWAARTSEGEVFVVAGYVPDWVPVEALEPPPGVIRAAFFALALLTS